MKDLSNLTSNQLQKVYEKVFGLRPVTDNRRFLINNLMMPLKLPVKNCIERSTQNPRTSQRKVINFINDPDNNSLLVVHGTGCGKTLSAVVASQCYLDRHPNNKVVFVAPASLLNNFRDGLYNYGVTNLEKYDLYSFAKFSIESQKGNIDCRNSMLIIDEVHNLRTLIQYRTVNKKRTLCGKRSLAVLNCSFSAHKRLLLTATPFINNPDDFVNLINILYGKKVIQKKIGQNFTPKVQNNLITWLLGKVDYIPSCRGNSEFPRVVEKMITVKMSPEYQKIYKKLINRFQVNNLVFDKPEVFYNGYRKAVNKVGVGKYLTPKFKEMLKHMIKGGKIQKTVIYTNWLEFGVQAISEFLNRRRIPFQVFSGQVNATKKKELVDAFNRDEYPVLIITKAGSEGLDLLGVRNIFVLDPVWNPAIMDQIVGRGVRYRSHVHLPKAEQQVNIYKMKLVSHDGTVETGDEKLYDIIARKEAMQNLVTEILHTVSI